MGDFIDAKQKFYERWENYIFGFFLSKGDSAPKSRENSRIFRFRLPKDILSKGKKEDRGGGGKG